MVQIHLIADLKTYSIQFIAALFKISQTRYKPNVLSVVNGQTVVYPYKRLPLSNEKEPVADTHSLVDEISNVLC